MSPEFRVGMNPMEGFKTMGQIRHVLALGACILIMVAFAGCAGSNFDADSTPVAVYHPKLPAGIETLDAARRDLAGLLENRGSVFEFDARYCAQHSLQDLMLSDAGRSEIKKGAVANSDAIYSFFYPPKDSFEIAVGTNSISVQKDMLKESSRLFLSYADLPDLPIGVKEIEENDFWVFLGDQQVEIGGLNKKEAYKVADDLYFIQQHIIKTREHRLAQFKENAAKYRALAIKPAMSEEQRKLIVQANYFSRQKDYDKALDLYNKAVAVDPVAYPAAYFNMALLAAQENDFSVAIFRMKQYLLLVPNAKDARSAQDKIYEWEAAMGK